MSYHYTNRLIHFSTLFKLTIFFFAADSKRTTTGQDKENKRMSSSHPWHLKHTLSCQGSGIILEDGLEEMYIGRTYIQNLTLFS